MNLIRKLQNRKLVTTIGLILIGLSAVFFGLIFVVPFLPLTVTTRSVLVTACIISLEVAWWAGVAILGKQVITKYKRYLNPRNWFNREKELK